MDDVHRAPSVVELARLLAPGCTVTETSHPTPALLHWNVAVVVEDEQDARNAVLALESLESDTASVGLTVLSPATAPGATTEERAHQVAPTAEELPGLDREGVLGDIAPRALKGALIGAVVGAVVIGLPVLLIAGAVAGLAAAIGGVLFGSAIGWVWGAFVRMGGSDAYRQTFLDPADPSIFMVSLHTGDDDEARAAADRLGTVGDVVRTEYDGDRLHRV